MPSERVREARDVLSNWRPRTSADAAFWEDVDALLAAVRAETLAEFAQQVDEARRAGAKFVASLTTLEATDGR